MAPATWSELAELRAPSDALLADASAWAADPRAARDAEMEILEREMRGGNAWASRDADAAAPEPAEAGAVDEAAARADGMRLLRRSTAAIVRDEHRQRLVGVRKALDLAAVRAAMPLDGAAVPGSPRTAARSRMSSRLRRRSCGRWRTRSRSRRWRPAMRSARHAGQCERSQVMI